MDLPAASPLKRLLALVLLCLAMALPTHLSAQSFSASITPTTGSIGKIYSAASGETVYSISAADGSVTRSSGGGLPVAATSTRAMVTVSCSGTGNLCGDNRGSAVVATVTIAAFGTPSGRAMALRNFEVAAGTGTPSATQGSGSTFTFTISANFRAGATRTFYLGGDFPFNATGTTGPASSSYTVTASGAGNPTGSVATAAFSATVHRPISLSKDSDLSFGSILPPKAGTNTITIEAGSGTRSISDGGNGLLMSGSTPSHASFTINGEGGQAYSVTVPSSVTMTGPSGTLTAPLTVVGATGNLPNAEGSGGSATIGIGGSIDVSAATIPGSYSGSFGLTVQYN